MQKTTLRKEIFWYKNRHGATSSALSQNLETEIAVIGGGMAGLMCALRLQELGKKVVLLEKDFCGGGASGKSSGFSSPDSELELTDLVENHGEETGKTLWEFARRS